VLQLNSLKHIQQPLPHAEKSNTAQPNRFLIPLPTPDTRMLLRASVVLCKLGFTAPAKKRGTDRLQKQRVAADADADADAVLPGLQAIYFESTTFEEPLSII